MDFLSWIKVSLLSLIIFLFSSVVVLIQFYDFGCHRFAEVAELLWVCWLEIRVEINISMLSPSTMYIRQQMEALKSSTSLSKDQIADIFFKPLAGARSLLLRNRLRILSRNGKLERGYLLFKSGLTFVSISTGPDNIFVSALPIL
ncbi:hypothetical protein NC652_018041 [Populus alba x Populus x berolinensis]|nr:hypothetical protein NC652_018041 [Populus alba x Populus x berolinensis]